MSENQIVEWAPFELSPHVTEEALLRASQALQEEFLSRQRGFLRRELLRGKGRRWVDLVYWADQEAADAAVKAATESSVCHVYFQLMAGVDHAAPGDGVLHFERAASYPPSSDR